MAKNKGGAPTKYKKDLHDEMVFKILLLGATDKECSEIMGIHKDTFYEWKKVHKSFKDSVIKAKQLADAEVAAGLYKKARGLIKTREITEEYGEVTKVVTKEIAPDTGAIAYWLKCRQPKKWNPSRQIKLENAVQDGFDDVLKNHQEKMAKENKQND